jgi:hypothetical protein
MFFVEEVAFDDVTASDEDDSSLRRCRHGSGAHSRRSASTMAPSEMTVAGINSVSCRWDAGGTMREREKTKYKGNEENEKESNI